MSRSVGETQIWGCSGAGAERLLELSWDSLASIWSSARSALPAFLQPLIIPINTVLCLP